ncbi:methionine synthase reductase-like isoform X2 [Zophobas morio]|uniref:methionine synthase reductase-like isoform X2 n=1 Tax=Zophobas morio TaxID=2755281 RepID=UPI0030837E79
MAPLNLTLIYASQTGTAESVAKGVYHFLLENELFDRVRLFCASELNKKFFLEDLHYTIFVISTTGDGDPPDSAEELWKAISRVEKNIFSNVHYAILGLGNSTYSTFCGAAKFLEQQLSRGGAVCFLSTCMADDAVGIEISIYPWLDRLIYELNKVSQGESQSLDIPTLALTRDLVNLQITDLQVPKFPSPFLSLKFDLNTSVEGDSTEWPRQKKNFFKAFIKEVKTITSKSAVKVVKKMVVSVEDLPCRYKPGDAFGFVCRNNKDEVNALLSRLNLTSLADQTFTLQIRPKAYRSELPKHLPPSGHSPRSILTNFVDIRRPPRRTTLRAFAECCADLHERSQCLLLSSPQEYSSLCQSSGGSLLSLLSKWPSMNIPFERLLELLPPLNPRYYSACSSPLVNPYLIEFVFSVVEFPNTCPPLNKGVCTGWLEQFGKTISISRPLTVFLRPSRYFCLPDNLRTPIIMVCTGTGVAPFISFLRHRYRQLVNSDPNWAHSQLAQQGHHQFSWRAPPLAPRFAKRLGPTWLFFGCRTSKDDFLFKAELKYFLELEILTKLTTAFSRETSEKIYVQHKLREYGKEIVQLMEQEAVLYICGDASRMIKEVEIAIIEILMQYKEVTKEEAMEQLLKWNSTHKVIRDVWI